MARVHPAISELGEAPIASQRPELELGAWYVLNALRALDDEWTVFVQPHLGVDRPDFVLAHPSYGVCVIVVRDWPVGSYRLGDDGGIEVQSGGSWWPCSDMPLFEVSQHRNAICERFFDRPSSDPAMREAVRGVVMLPRFRTGDARELFGPGVIAGMAQSNLHVWGGGALKIALLGVVTGKTKPVRHRALEHGHDRLCEYLATSGHLDELLMLP
jgi:hypothetical protein